MSDRYYRLIVWILSAVLVCFLCWDAYKTRARANASFAYLSGVIGSTPDPANPKGTLPLTRADLINQIISQVAAKSAASAPNGPDSNLQRPEAPSPSPPR